MKIQTRLTQITPFYMFCKQVKDNMGNIRVTNENNNKDSTFTDLQFMPTQFGGIFGQNSVLVSKIVMEMTEFDGGDNSTTTSARKYLGTPI